MKGKSYCILGLFIALCLGILGLFHFLNTDINYKNVQSGNVKGESSIIEVKIDTPFDTVFHFYKAVEGNNWELARVLVTPSLWEYLQGTGFDKKWENIKRKDPSLRFMLFIVRNHFFDEEKGEGWMMGRADWSSDMGKDYDFNSTVFLKKIGETWKITKIMSVSSIETVDNFYKAINEGNFLRMQELLTRRYWIKLKSSGVIDALQREQFAFRKGVYVVFYADDFVEKKNEAWVKGDVIWKPLTKQEKEIHVNIHLIKENNVWKIDKIVGHWNEEK
ncbi:MAG TPA: hypothetical protein DEA47_01240 [Peptococcaceae bacterium]|nr:MAG: hypothetical protein XD50_0242 [Clostridia bacterium 41_269]HBT19986.1 hypothetical protein [Peptococcaceae bacterium]